MKKYSVLLFLLLPLLAFFSISVSSCNPYRSGPTAKQIGASSGKKYHTSPASAKRRGKRNY